MNRIKPGNRRNEARQSIRGPDVVICRFAYGPGLAKKEIFLPHVVHEHIEWAGENAIDASVKEMAWRRVSFEQDAKRMRGIETFNLREPERAKGGVRFSFDVCAFELTGKLFGCAVCKARVYRDKALVENRRPEKAGHLLLLDRITGKSEGMSKTRENESGHFPIERLVKGDFPFFEGEHEIAEAKFYTV